MAILHWFKPNFNFKGTKMLKFSNTFPLLGSFVYVCSLMHTSPVLILCRMINQPWILLPVQLISECRHSTYPENQDSTSNVSGCIWWCFHFGSKFSGLGSAEIDAHSRTTTKIYFSMPRLRGNIATRNIHQVS